jgi:hypothetical protein
VDEDDDELVLRDEVLELSDETDDTLCDELESDDEDEDAELSEDETDDVEVSPDDSDDVDDDELESQATSIGT